MSGAAQESHDESAAAIRTLAVRCGAFGDMVLLTALIRMLHACYGGPVDVLCSGPWSEPLLRGQPGVGEVLSVRSRKTPYWLAPDQHRVVRRLRARGPGPTWFCDANDAARGMLARAGISRDLIVDVRDHPLLPGEHATQHWRRLAQVVPAALAGSARADAAAVRHGAREVEPGCALTVSAAQQAELAQFLRRRAIDAEPLILIQAGNKRTMRRGLKRLAVNHKYWPVERWAAVMQGVRDLCPRHAIVLIGTGPEYELNRALAARAGIDRCYNVADDLPIPRLVALLARAAGLITVDSGPAHAAAAVGCPQVVLFGKASIPLYRPFGVPHADVAVLSGVIDGEPSMLGIAAESVLAAWQSLELRGSPPGHRMR